MRRILVTGALGFIGSCFAIQEVAKGNLVIGLDNRSYSANIKNISSLEDIPNFVLINGDIRDADLVSDLLHNYDIHIVAHFAAESHVDRSIGEPINFINTNINGTYSLLSQSLNYWASKNRFKEFRFLHVSTDEVYGELSIDAKKKFNEQTPYSPRSPYSASKAASDHLVKAWFHTYGLPVIVTNCSNNYGPRQHNEKLIPRMISCALAYQPLPVYGDGKNIRDWIHVEDHCRALSLVIENGVIGDSYCIGGDCDKQNIEIIREICAELDILKKRPDKRPYEEQIAFVDDRLGHDLRYSIDNTKIRGHLGFSCQRSFKEGLKETIKWYVQNADYLS